MWNRTGGKWRSQNMIVVQESGCTKHHFRIREKLQSLSETEASSKSKECSQTVSTPSSMSYTQKRSRSGGGICSMKAFVEQHPESQLELQDIWLASSLKLANKLQKNVQAVAQAVSIHISKVLTEHCYNEGIYNSRRMLHHIYSQTFAGKTGTCTCEGSRMSNG